jgi:hypothetical protein
MNGTKYNFQLKLYDDHADPSLVTLIYQHLRTFDKVDLYIGPSSDALVQYGLPFLLLTILAGW